MIPLPSRNLLKPSAEINIVPYIDVMLVLLIIFMVTAPILEQGIEVELPPSSQSQVIDVSNFTDDELSVIEITLDKTGNYSIGEEKNLPANILLAKVIAIRDLNPKVRVRIRGDKKVDYAKFIELIDHLKSVDMHNFNFITIPLEKI